jgi:hypothetical protein
MNKIASKSLIILACVVFCLGTVIFLLRLAREGNSERQSAQREPASDSKASCGHDDWVEYTDNDYGYRICHPAGLTAVPLSDGDLRYESFGGMLDPNGGVSFAALGKGVFGVKIYKDAPVDSLDEWLKLVNSGGEKYRQEKDIVVDGNEAMVTHLVSVTAGQEESFLNEKKTVFFRGGYLFEIWTSFYGDDNAPQTVWDSFHFIDNPKTH